MITVTIKPHPTRARPDRALDKMSPDPERDTDVALLVPEGHALSRPSVFEDGYAAYLKRSLRAVFLSSKLNALLVCVPGAIASRHAGGSEGLVFIVSLLGICPLAERLGFLTEQLAEYTNPTVGGLLNATFGNLTEVIVSVFALRAGLLRVVQLSLLGSVLSNTLLVLGCAFLFGGTKRKEQRFNAEGTSMNFGLLMLSALAMALPTLLRASRTELRAGPSELSLSRSTAVVLLCTYGGFLYYQLVTHTHLFEEKDDDDDDDEEREEESALGFWGCIFWLGVATLFISVLSNYVVDTIDDAAVAANIPVAFIAVIVLPIVGNAAEHASAVMFALKDKLDLSMGVAVGSATQISLLVLPFTVVLGWFLGAPMDLNMELYETVVLLLTVGVVALVCQDGRSDWLKGFILCATYALVAASFFFHKDNALARGNGHDSNDVGPDF